MSKAQNDRNTVIYGPNRAAFEYKLDRIEEQVEDFKRDVQPIVNDYEAGTIGGGAFIGEVDTYDPITYLGDFVGGIEFFNGTGFGLGQGDEVVYVIINGQPTAVSVYQRAGSYTPTIYNNPQINNNFPYDGDALPTQHNYPIEVPIGATAYTAATQISNVVGFYATGVLGYTGRIVVMLGGNDRIAQPNITIYNVETGAVTNISRAAAVGATNRTRGLGAVGTRLFVTYDGTSGNCVESWDSTTGTWSTHAISHAVYAGVSDGRAWWVGFSSGGTRYRVHSIDGSGTLSSIDYPVNIAYNSNIAAAASSWVFAKAKNGRLWASIQTTTQANNRLVTCSTATAAASVTFTNNASPCAATLSASYAADNQFLWSRVGSGAGNTDYRDLVTAEVSSDIDTNGDLWYALRAGSPLCWGFAIIDAATQTQTVYGTVMSATGDVVDGEPTLLGGFSIAGTEAVIFGAIYEVYHLPASTRTLSWLPTWWRSDGAITASNVDDSYLTVIANGPLSDGINVTGRTAVIPRYDTTDTSFVFLTNIGNNIEGQNLTQADAAGPAVITALTL